MAGLEGTDLNLTSTSEPERLETVLQVIYLVFNEGYSASSGESVTRSDLSAEAIRLGRLLMELLPEPSGALVTVITAAIIGLRRRS